jgi:hypothetical protein
MLTSALSPFTLLPPPPPSPPPQDRHYQQRYEGHTHGHHTASSRLTVDDLVRCQDAAAAVRLTAADLRLYFYSIDYCL